MGKAPASAAVEKPAREVERSAPKETAPALKDPAKATAAEAAPPAGDGFAVQIAALNVRSEADAIAKRLSSKGYSAYVMSPANGTPSVYRVRVGKFPTRREAESIAARLQKEEQFKPWVTR
jgi:DedD protein